jgi:hypothetical protein
MIVSAVVDMLSIGQSLWSTTNTFKNLDNAMLFVVMVIVGLVTYSIVFNLNNIAQSIFNRYDYLKKGLISRMKYDDESWRELSRRFDGFRPQRLNTTPSEWWILWYIVVLPYKQAMKWLERLLRNRNQFGDRETATNSTTWDGGQDDWLHHTPLPQEVQDHTAAGSNLGCAESDSGTRLENLSTVADPMRWQPPRIPSIDETTVPIIQHVGNLKAATQL